MVQFLILIFVSGMCCLLSFMGLAFSAPGTEIKDNPALARFTDLYIQAADILLQIHMVIMPIYLMVVLGVFFFKSKEIGLLLVKWSFALPVVSFLCIALYFTISSRLGK